MDQSIYIDANILIGYFEKKNRDIKKIAREAISKTQKMVRGNSEIIVKIPTIVLAEFMQWYIEDCSDEEVLSQFEALVEKLDADFPAPKKEHYELAIKLMNEDDRVNSHDALIVSHALLDPTTTWLLTTDTVLHNNKVIEKEKKRLENRFKISDRIG
ncbi:hypothetical protein DRP04_11100 [Archaeoglobales archaeon]|nr:MAG: hypothetical protein DRP04_11100 [Archaeoglobales archaeon]